MPTTTIILFWTIIGSLTILIIFFIFIYKITKLYNSKQLEFESELKLKQIETEKQLLHTRIEVQEETLQKISREIHDNVNQLLTLSKMNLNSIAINPNDSLSATIKVSNGLISSAISELTNISRALNSELINDLGIVRSLEAEAERISQIEKITININSDYNFPELEPEVQISIYRIFQEVTRNSIIHGKAQSISVELKNTTGTIFYSIIDDGIGFNYQDVLQNEKNKHQGLRNIRKRVTLLNGSININSKEGSGTIISIKIPLKTN